MRHLDNLTRARKTVGLVGFAAAIGLAASISLAKAGIPAPQITTHPAKITARSTVQFAFRDRQRGVRFVCSFDGSKPHPCKSPVTYKRLVSKRHTFLVRAVSGREMSAATVIRFTVDRTPPLITVSFPSSGGAYNAGAWDMGCAHGNVCGTATDPIGIRTVLVSLRQKSTGRYWNGKQFASASERYLTARVENADARMAHWSFRMPRPADGGYLLHARASDRVQNGTPRREAIFVIDTAAPPAPSIATTPNNPTTDGSASFSFADAEGGVTFFCSLDGASNTGCGSPTNYGGLAQGAHIFSVQARDAAGNASPAASYSWTIQPGVGFTIAGDVPGSLYPGGEASSIPLTLGNPNDVLIHVDSLAATVRSTGTSGCDADWFEIAPASIPTGGITIPPRGSVTLPSPDASPPSIRMVESHTNQDACQGAHLTLNYSGSAHS